MSVVDSNAVQGSSSEKWVQDGPVTPHQEKKKTLGFRTPVDSEPDPAERERLLRYINLQLIAHGFPAAETQMNSEISDIAQGLLQNHQEKTRLLSDHRCPVDERIEDFLEQHFADVELDEPLRLPGRTLVLDQHGMARELSLPAGGNEFQSSLVSSYRVRNGVLHNPESDRRTTAGTFHVTQGGLPIPGEKKSVPKKTFAALFQIAVNPPEELLTLPFTSQQEEQAKTFVSLLLRPIVCPEVRGICEEQTMEVRFFAPGNFVSNLDFVESIFGNAGDPYIPRNDAGLDILHWSGHTGCVILAPQLSGAKKKDVGLPHWDDADELQREQGMCWKDENEIYNDGSAFKITCRTEAGIIITLISDNYFGYCKKEVKTQISYAANLSGNFEEEHAGGAIAFPAFNLGEEFQTRSRRYNGRTFADVQKDYAEWIDVQPEGYGIDRNFPDLYYIPEDANANLSEQRIAWKHQGERHTIPLLPGKVYMAPSGYKLRMEKHPGSVSWRLVGEAGEGTFCHKPCTVSGGGKSEISKSLVDYMHYGPVFVANIQSDFDEVQKIIEKDFSTRWGDGATEKPDYEKRATRGLLDKRRSLGSVIKLLTPSEQFNKEYNDWLKSIPNHIYALVFSVKRWYRPEWGDNWREHFSVDIVNGSPGHELKHHQRQLVGTYLRVGFDQQHHWRMYKVRQDFVAAAKIQTEDDISASVVVPGNLLHGLNPKFSAESYKFLINCEYRLFQRPDDAIHRGLDLQTEKDLSHGGNFISNFEPLTKDAVAKMREYVVEFDAFSPPMQELLKSLDTPETSAEYDYIVCSANPRQIDGKPTKNPRYLQDRPDLVKPLERYVGEMGTRLFRAIPADKPVPFPVNAVIFGRRNNPPEPENKIRALAVYGPIHYQELPELFMDFICSLTGKSPSTTGAGTEGALTKGPFNALRQTADLNTALVSYLLTGLAGFSSAAGHVGPNMQVDHDLSLMIPEIWCRLEPSERDPAYLIKNQMLEKVQDFEHDGELIPASRLGYRITDRFVRQLLGRIFDNPRHVFDESLLKPETQDLDAFADGVKHIAEAHERVARRYFTDGSIKEACPPLKKLLHIMAYGDCEGLTLQSPELREMFTLSAMLESDWYQERLETRQKREIALWEKHVAYLQSYEESDKRGTISTQLGIPERSAFARQQLDRVSRPEHLQELQGFLGADPLREVE